MGHDPVMETGCTYVLKHFEAPGGSFTFFAGCVLAAASELSCLVDVCLFFKP